MNETERNKNNDDAADSNRNAERHPTKKKSAPKAPTNKMDTSPKESNKEERSLKSAGASDDVEPKHTYEAKGKETLEKQEDTQVTPTADQVVPEKSKKKRAPKINESNPIEEPIKKKKSKAPKPPLPPIDDEFQIIDNSAVNETQPYIEPKPKEKKHKKSKPPDIEIADSFEELQVTNLDDISPTDLDIDSNDASVAFTLPPKDDTSEFQKSIIDIYSNLSSKIDFSQYVGNDQWDVNHLPKSARTEPKSRIRRILPSGNKNTKSGIPKGSLFNRLSSGINTLINDQNNIVFGKQQMSNVADFEDEADGVDTDNLHRYAQQLRDLEDQDREVNPEFLVLHDGKTIYGVHESDADGKTQLAKRKPLYDRFADQRPDESVEKKKLLSRLKIPFTRRKDKEEKTSKSGNATPEPALHRKSSRKSLNVDLTTIPSTDL